MSDKKEISAKSASETRDPMKVTEALARRVISGEWPEGMPMPTELALAEQMGVARASIREGLTRLKAKGLLASRQKSGTRVLPRMQWNMLDEDVLRWVWSGSDRNTVALNLMQLRNVIEPAACEIAASIGPDTAIAAIERAYRQMDAAGTDAAAYAGPDLDFHRAILTATGNPFFVSLGSMIEAALRMSFELSTLQPGAPRKSLPLHRDVLDKIWAREPQEARKAMQILLDRTEANIRLSVSSV